MTKKINTKNTTKKALPPKEPQDGDGRVVEYMNDSYQAEVYRTLVSGHRWVEVGPRVGDIRFAKQYIEDDRIIRERQREKDLLEMRKNTVRKIVEV